MKVRIRNVFHTYSGLFLLGLLGIPIGAIVGGIDVLFGKGLLAITTLREAHPFYFLPLLSVAGVAISYCYRRFGGRSGKGMNLIFAVGHGDEEVIPLRLIPFVVSGTWLTHLFGGSAGREGVAVQIGATFSHWVGRKLPIKNASRIFLVTGMAAGFAGLFETPIAATLFALEVLVAGSMTYSALLPAFTAAFTASTVSGLFGLEKFSFAVSAPKNFGGVLFWKMVLLGILFGVVGGAFAWCLKKAKQRAEHIFKNPECRIFILGALLSVLFLTLWKGRYSGLGTNLIAESFGGGTRYAWDWIIKFLLTVLTLAAGFLGGEVTPLFAIGASLGVSVAHLFGLPAPLVAALGYAAVFGGATNTLFAPVFIGAEVFGFASLPYFFVVCSVAYVFNMNKSIYSLQKLETLRKSE